MLRRSPIVKLITAGLIVGAVSTSQLALGSPLAADLYDGATYEPLAKAARSAPPTTTAPTVDPETDVATPNASTTPTAEQPSVPVGNETEVDGQYAVKDHLRTGLPIPRSTADQPTGNFRAICEFSHFAYDDPILAPGMPGASHLHMYFGNTRTDAFSTYESLRTTGDSTCQGGPLNRSAYWAPALIDTAGQALAPDFISVYYKGRGYGQDGERVDVVNMPPGLRMVAGAIPGDPSSESRHEWNCENKTLRSATIPTCDPGQRVGVVLHFPTCWDGRQLDAPDHRSHVIYPLTDDVTGQPYCPASHPESLPEFTLGIWFTHNGDSADWHLASDRMPGQPVHPNGSSYHSDWFGAWDQDVQQTWITECINGELDCSWGDLGNGTALSVNPEYTGPSRILPPPLPADQARSALADASVVGVSSLTCVLYGGSS